MDKALNLPPENRSLDFSYSPASIAGVGFALTVFPVGVERGWISREKALHLTRTTLLFFKEKMESKNGFFYHFVDMKTGNRAMNCEISSIDTAIFISGALFAAQYFRDPEVNSLALHLYSQIDWVWMTNGGKFISMGWTPENGFIPASWDHYSEGLLLYVLALGAPSHPVGVESWDFQRVRGRYKNHTYLINPPLFTHQFPQVWLDLRNQRDNYADYFESSRQATLANREFCLDLRPSFQTFGENRWGLTACIGPDGYQAYGAPPNPAVVDGTIAPAAAACSIVFTPEISLAALREYYQSKLLAQRFGQQFIGRFGLSDSFNLDRDFVASEAFAINQGPMLLMIENARTGFIWKNFMKIPCIQRGMKKADFQTNTEGIGFSNDLNVFETAVYMPHRRPVYESPGVSEDFSLENGFDCLEWSNSPPILIDQKMVQTILKPFDRMDFRMLWRMLHNTRSLFMRFDVYDSDLSAAHPEEKMYLDDSIEVYLNSQNQPFNWIPTHNFQIILSPDSSGQNLRVREFLHGGLLSGHLTWKFERLKNGYRIILEIPREDFEIADVRKFALGIASHDVNTARTIDVKYNWFFPLPSMIIPEMKLQKLQKLH